MIDPATTPEQLLEKLGIKDPRDIDINAIAYYCGATIVYERLTGCEANITGYGAKAIITVNSECRNAGRKRFSAGHELGHWMKDRGQSAFGCTDRQLDAEWSDNNPEVRANRFASDLVLPGSLFTPLAKNRPITIATVHDLAETFQMSLTATALKLVDLGSYPAMIVFYDGGKRRWFFRPRSVPQSFLPSLQVERGTATHKLLSDPLATEAEEDVRADRWCQLRTADQYYIREGSFKTGDDSAVALLWWEDEQQIIDMEEQEERNAARRSDWRDE
jgi:IrrE N-terminal-like domain